ncbi:acetyltransferase [Microbacterium phosphatis]|uniref:acetyltransferase n=1 Tax=Microbacterium phosphatis TaxID=3140248 RepID=UPI00314071A8
MTSVMIRPVAGSTEYPRLVGIWRSAVRATHDFLAEEDRRQIESVLESDYLPQVLLTAAEADGRIVGFAGTAGGRLEMLFVEAAQRGRGVGRMLLEHVVAEQEVVALDVNEQNAGAARFYERNGFRVTGRSEVDEAGRPYPLLHLSLAGRCAG